MDLGVVNRAFVKRTRRGQVKTHVRQTYLRDDLPTGSPFLDAAELEPKLSASASRYLVLDTNVVLHQIDLLEKPALCDVIVLQTVLEEVRHNKISVHKRLRALVSDARRRFHVFSNEFHRETHVERQPGESPNDRNDRAIRRAVEWYAAQLAGEEVEVLLLTNDAENKRKALDAGLKAQSIHAHVRSLPEADELSDLLAGDDRQEGGGGGEASASDGGGGAKRQKGAIRYAAHLPLSQLTKGVAAGELHQGKLHVNRHNPQQAHVTSTIPGHSSVLLRDRQAMNRALDGDTVVVAAPRLRVGGGRRGGARRPGDGDGDDDELTSGGGGAAAGAQVFAPEFDTTSTRRGAAAAARRRRRPRRPPTPRKAGRRRRRACGEVVGVVKRAWRPYVCVLDTESAIGQQLLAEPLDVECRR